MGCLLKRLPDICEILARAKKIDSLQLFVFGQDFRKPLQIAAHITNRELRLEIQRSLELTFYSLECAMGTRLQNYCR